MIASLFTLVVLAVAKWLVRETQDRAVLVRALVRNIALCSQARHLTLTGPLICLGVVTPHLWPSTQSRGEYSNTLVA